MRLLTLTLATLSLMAPIASASAAPPVVQAGILQCRGGQNVGFVVGSVTSLECVFQSDGRRPEPYIAKVQRIGLDLGVTALVTAAVHGHGLVFAPLPLVLPLFRSNTLVPLLPDRISKPAHLFIHYPNRKHLPVRVRSFVNFALDRFRNNPDLVSDPQRLIAPFVRAR